MLRPEIEIIEVLDVVTASTVAPTTTTKPGLQTPDDEF